MARRDRFVIAGLAVLASVAIVAAGASVVGASGQDRPKQAAAIGAGRDGQAGIPAFAGRGGRRGSMGPGGPGMFGGLMGPGGRGGHGLLGGPMLFELDLTADERQQIRTIRDEARTASEPYRELLRQAQGDLGVLVRAEAFDESAVRAIAATEGKALAELRVIGARAEAAVFALLTPEQRAALEAMRPPRAPR